MFITAMLVVAAFGTVTSEFQSRDFEQTLENVRANERLYDNIEVSMRERYELQGEPPRFTDSNLKVDARRESKLRYVSQQGMFRLDREGSRIRGENERRNMDRSRAFDGTTTRLFDQGKIGNLISGRAEDHGFVRPHMMLMRPMGEPSMVPLSTYMGGHEAMAAHPSVNWDGSIIMENTYQGEVEFRDLKCHKILLTNIVKDTNYVNDRWELWLAEERNYIPVRLFGYTFRWSKDIPVCEGTVTELREIAPGIWFPFAAHIVRYDSIIIESGGKQKEKWREEYVTEDASLDPKYGVEFFRNVEFPDGTVVYEIDDKQITRGYVQGAPEAPGGPKFGFGRWWLLWVNLGLVVIVAAFLVARKVMFAGR